MKILMYIAAACFTLIVAIAFVVISCDLYLTMKYGAGFVDASGKRTFVKEFIREENGCIEFVDVWGNKMKACETYTVKKY